MCKYLCLLLICVLGNANAAELFGVELQSATREQLRTAVKNAGVKLVSEAGDDAFFDVYKADSVIHNATLLYLGFVKSDKKFAFAEYELIGPKQLGIIQKLTKKYGPATVEKGRFLSDRRYQWQSNGIKVELYLDWPAYRTRLTYFNPAALQQLRSEQKQYNIALRQQQEVYLEKAY